MRRAIPWSLCLIGLLLTTGCSTSSNPDAAAQAGDGDGGSDRSVGQPSAGKIPGTAMLYPAAEGQGPRYRWNGGGQFVYSVRIEADKEDETDITQGNCFFTVQPDRPEVRGPADAEPKGTATAFVVHSDGYLLTCAHVVNDAKKLEVALGQKSYAAKVLKVDKPHDLALLRIEARDLPALPLLNSDAVELGQEVRAFGFPLSSVLGDTIKVTRGTISGIQMKEGQKYFQVDASINPGNSGGPLMNEQAQVVGVTNAKLAGVAVSNVGFAVPINFAKALLKEQNVGFITGGAPARLDGPALVKRVAGSVALVNVVVDPNQIAGAEAYKLTVNGNLLSHQQPKPGVGGIPRMPRFNFAPFGGLGAARNASITIDEWGNVLRARGDSQLPFVLGNLAQLVVEPLSREGQDKWEVTGMCTIEEKSSDRAPLPGMPRGMPGLPGRPRGGFGPPGFPGAPGMAGRGDGGSKTYQAVERTVYTLGKPVDNLVEITKRYELKSVEAGGQAPHLQVTGDGQITFDLKAGLPKALKFDLVLQENSGNASYKLPVTVTYKLLEGAELARAQQPPPAANPPANPPGNAPANPPANPPAGAGRQPPAKALGPLTDEEFTRVLADLKAGDPLVRQRAADRLFQSPPNDRRAEVAKILAAMLEETNPWPRNAAAQALGVWGSKENCPALLKLLSKEDPWCRWAAMKSLGLLQDASAAEPIAQRLAVGQDRGKAAEALKSLGAVAEPAVLKMVKHDDLFTRLEAVQILKVIGTKASEETLQGIAEGSDVHLRVHAKLALEAIKARQ